jgi:hypothetical protein
MDTLPDGIILAEFGLAANPKVVNAKHTSTATALRNVVLRFPIMIKSPCVYE